MKRGQRITPVTGVRSSSAKETGIGHTMEFGDNAVAGAWYQIDSGWGIPNFGVLSWHPWGNAIDWVYPHGQNGALFEWPDFNYYGPVFYVHANQRYDLTRYGWENRVESLFQYW